MKPFVLGLLLLVSVVVWSQGPTPGHIKGGPNQQGHGSNEEKQRKATQGIGTPPAPTPVSAAPSADNASRDEEKTRKEGQQRATSDRLTLDSTIAVAIATVFIAIATCVQIAIAISADRKMERNLALTKQSADAATDAANTARDALHHTERAVLSPAGVLPVQNGPSEVNAVIRLTNTGRTPAKNVKVETGITLSGALPEIPVYDAGVGLIQASLPPGGTIWGIAQVDIRDKFGTGMHVYCRATYEDVFGKAHCVQCIAMEGGVNGERFTITTAPGYDYAD